MNRIGPCLLVLGLVALVGWGTSTAGRGADRLLPPPGRAAKPLPDEGNRGKGAVKGRRPAPKITVGKETTYATGPLDEDGYVDYEAALNERLGKGIAPKDNANVLLWKALGPRPEGAPVPPAFFRRLGMTAPPERGEYFIDLLRYAKEHLRLDPPEQIYDQQGRAVRRAWVAKECPHIAGWLEVNEKPLALVVEATQRPKYFNSLVVNKNEKGSGGLISALLPGAQKCRELAAALAARALLRAGEGRFDEAWQDLLACRRLGRLVARGAMLIEALVGIAINQIAVSAELAFLDRARLNAGQARACLRDLQRLPALPPLADKMDLGERFMFLDSVQLLQRGGLEALEGLGAPDVPRKKPDPLARQALDAIDWDPALRTANRWFDRVVAALRIKDRAAREKELARIHEELKSLKDKAGDAGEVVQALRGGEDAGKAVGQKIGEIMISLLMPAYYKMQQAADRAEQLQRNQYVAFALAAYRADHGRYPERLDGLSPKYLAQVPRDLFSGKALIYRPSEEGYLLYSVGVNGRDEGGRWYDDDPAGDDPRVRIPLPPWKPKP
jgi:hypothetical protein